MFFYSCNEPEKQNITKTNTIENIITSLKSHNSIHFNIIEKYNYSGIIDTTITEYEIWVIRDKIDSLRNGFIWVDNNYRPYNMIYENSDFLLAIPPKKVSVLYKNYTESFINKIDWIDIFLKPEILHQQFDNENNISSISDTLIADKHFTKINISFATNSKGKKENVIYLLDDNNIPVWAKLISVGRKRTYYNELFFSDIEFDNVNIDKLKERKSAVLKDNPVGDRGSGGIRTIERMLHIGEKAPLFAGDFYSNRSEFKLKDYIGKKVIIVDFWYTHCPPCVRAIPELSKLAKQYQEKDLVVFGLNSVDNQERSMGNLNKFLAKRSLNYNIILTRPEVDIAYKIIGYPSMYIVDLDGNIAYVELGFDEESFEKLKIKVAQMLD
jgi:thiol-disulfide isomerase/thioredoxin